MDSCWLMSYVVDAITRGSSVIAAGGCSAIITYVVLLLLLLMMVLTLRCGCRWTSTKNENEKGDDNNKIIGEQQQKQNLDSTSILGPFFLSP